MNVGVGDCGRAVLFWEYLFRIFGIVSLQCTMYIQDIPGQMAMAVRVKGDGKYKRRGKRREKRKKRERREQIKGYEIRTNLRRKVRTRGSEKGMQKGKGRKKHGRGRGG